MTIHVTRTRAIAALAALIATGLLVAWSGLVPIAASSGHWKITDWFLHWTMRNSVKTQSALTTPDDVVAREGLVSAAGHFAQSCASCHGAPGVRPLPVMQAATPPAPNLQVNARAWSDRHLHWILEHGIKFSGMPAWAAKDRPDEIRRMVAFVRALPTMTPTTYRLLVDGADAAVPGIAPGLVARCTGCHGTDGRGRGQPDIPVLGGQKPGYLLAALQRYAGGVRSSAVMQQAAATLSDAEMHALAKYFAAMPGLEVRNGETADDLRARRIAVAGLPERQLPPCLSCHSPARTGSYPILHGQRAAYLANRLARWRGHGDTVDARKPHAVMPTIARRIPEDMISPLAHYFAAGPSEPSMLVPTKH